MMNVRFFRLRFALLGIIYSAVISPAAGQAYDSLPNQPDYYRQRATAFRAEPVSEGKVVFLGNSITEGGDWRKLLGEPTVIQRGISGDNTFGVLARLDEIIRHKPSKLFLLIGVNDLSKNIPNAVIMQNIFSIVGRIHAESPQTRVFVQSILPVNPTHKKFPARFNKQGDIEVINGQLRKYAEALKYTYVDLFSAFLDSSGRLDLQYTYDGLHLGPAGYEHWVKLLRKENWL
ncbi:MAG: sialate O-acetylesterase [Cyclobacteriaceae bacterium]|nr:sialate O-acetylesterase [Cyclobacteriaceae bacterium]